MTDNRALAKTVAQGCTDAYSYGTYYNDRAWTQCAKELLDRGLNAKQVEGFMRSKHMRWSSSISTFRDYLARTDNFGVMRNLHPKSEGSLIKEAQLLADGLI